MKQAAQRFLPIFLILTGVLRILGECVPGRLGFLLKLGGAHHGWIFWALAVSGLVWLILRELPDSPDEKSSSAEGSRLYRFFQRYGIELVILLITAASLSMLIRSGYFWDDAVNSSKYLAEKKDSIPLWQHMLTFMRTYLRLGRINVLSVYYYFFFYIENVHLYKALIILTILIDQLIFRKVLLEFGVPLHWSRLGMLILPMLLQTRAYQDPVSGFYGLMQVLTAEMLLCAYFLSRWLRTGKRRFQVLSLFVFALGLMTYEVCFPFLLMICLLIWVRRGNFLKAVRDSLSFVLLVILMLGAVLLVREKYVTKSAYAGVAFSLNVPRILRAAMRQICAAIPLRFYSAGYQATIMYKNYPAAEFMNYSFGAFFRDIRMSDVLILLTAMAVMAWLLRKAGKKDLSFENGSGRSGLDLLVLGLSFAVLPCITVSLSKRYQGQLMPGLGYLPVYIEYFGVAILLVWLVMRLRLSDGMRALGLGFFAVILLLNLQNNRAVTELMNRSFYDPRNAGEAALHGGILDFLPEDAVLVSDNSRAYLWEADWNNHGLYRQFYGNNVRKLPAVTGDYKVLRDLINEAVENGAVPDAQGYIRLEPENVWLIAYNGDSARGLARLGRLFSAKVKVSNGSIKDAKTDQVIYFISGRQPEMAGVLYTLADGTFRQTGISGQHRVRESADGILYQLPKEDVIRFDSLSLDLSQF